MAEKSLSFHLEGGKARFNHNRRRFGNGKGGKHIDEKRSKNNIVLYDRNIRDVYTELFQEAQDEYNSKVKRKDREIKSYYSQILHDKKKWPVYEFIVQIGNCNDTNNNSLDEIKVLQEYISEFELLNPQMKIVQAIIHLDESTPHIHCSIVPISLDNARGMRVQNSISGACIQMEEQEYISAGHSPEEAKRIVKEKYKDGHTTPQMNWVETQRLYLESLCSRHGIEIAEAKKGHKHLSVDEYKSLQQEFEKRESDKTELSVDSDTLLIEEMVDNEFENKIQNEESEKEL